MTVKIHCGDSPVPLKRFYPRAQFLFPITTWQTSKGVKSPSEGWRKYCGGNTLFPNVRRRKNTREKREVWKVWEKGRNVIDFSTTWIFERNGATRMLFFLEKGFFLAKNTLIHKSYSINIKDMGIILPKVRQIFWVFFFKCTFFIAKRIRSLKLGF